MGPAYRWIDRLLPAKWNAALTEYSVGAQTVREASDWRKLIRFYFLNVIVFSVIIITLILLTTEYLAPLLETYKWNKIVAVVLILVLLSPFLWALAFRRTHAEAYAKVWSRPLQRGPLFLLLLSRVLLAVFYVGFLFDRMFSPFAALLGVLITCAILFFLRHKIQNFYARIELRFLANLNEKELAAEDPVIAPWDTHLAAFSVNAFSPVVGKTLLELQLRELFGVNIAAIERDDVMLHVPKRSERIYPGDMLSVIGTDEQLSAFKHYMDAPEAGREPAGSRQQISLEHFTIRHGSWLIGKSIRESRIREQTNGLVVGVERHGKRLLNPESDLVFQQADKLWIVGNAKRIHVIASKDPEAGG